MKKLAALILLLLVIFIVALYFVKTPTQSPVLNQSNNIEAIGQIYVYTNASTSEQLKISYDNTNNTAIIYPNEANRVVFNATTDSGARYTNNEQGLILWNKGNEISLYLNDSLIFTGTTENSN